MLYDPDPVVSADQRRALNASLWPDSETPSNANSAPLASDGTANQSSGARGEVVNLKDVSNQALSYPEVEIAKPLKTNDIRVYQKSEGSPKRPGRWGHKKRLETPAK